MGNALKSIDVVLDDSASISNNNTSFPDVWGGPEPMAISITPVTPSVNPVTPSVNPVTRSVNPTKKPMDLSI